MTAAFTFRDLEVWGTNGAIELYLDRLVATAVAAHGPGHVVTLWLQEERSRFFGGAVVVLDICEDRDQARIMVSLLAITSCVSLKDDGFSATGRQWIRESMLPFIEQLAAAS